MVNPADYIPFAEQLATIAGEIIRRYFRKSFNIEEKSDMTPVTVADREVEQNIRAAIHNAFPEHGIIGEEYESTNSDSDLVWVLDPIDGTKSFLIGRPIFGTLIALLYRGKPILGIIDQPILGERWTGVEGYATNFNYVPTRTRQCPSLDAATFCTTSPSLFSQRDLPSFERVRDNVKYVAYGGDCYSYGLLACGYVDVVLETGLKPHDFCALAPIIKGAGGIITDWEGKVLTLGSDGKVLACGDRKLHSNILKLLDN